MCPRCAKPICAPVATMRIRLPMSWLAGCWTGSDSDKCCLKTVDHSGIDQETVEAARLAPVIAAVEDTLTAEHDCFLLRKGGVEGQAGSLLNHQGQIRAVDTI